MDVETRHVGVHRDEVVGEIVVDDAAEVFVHHRLLVQRHADAPDHPPTNWLRASSGLRMRPAA